MTECERILMMIWTTREKKRVSHVIVLRFCFFVVVTDDVAVVDDGFQSIFVEIIFCVNKYWS